MSFTLICQNLIKPHVQVLFFGASRNRTLSSLFFAKEIETNLSKTAKHFTIYMQAACCRRAAHVAKHLTRQAVGGGGVCVHL